jgi:hypothetical protein
VHINRDDAACDNNYCAGGRPAMQCQLKVARAAFDRYVRTYVYIRMLERARGARGVESFIIYIMYVLVLCADGHVRAPEKIYILRDAFIFGPR